MRVVPGAMGGGSGRVAYNSYLLDLLRSFPEGAQVPAATALLLSCFGFGTSRSFRGSGVLATMGRKRCLLKGQRQRSRHEHPPPCLKFAVAICSLLRAGNERFARHVEPAFLLSPGVGPLACSPVSICTILAFNRFARVTESYRAALFQRWSVTASHRVYSVECAAITLNPSTRPSGTNRAIRHRPAQGQG